MQTKGKIINLYVHRKTGELYTQVSTSNYRILDSRGNPIKTQHLELIDSWIELDNEGLLSSGFWYDLGLFTALIGTIVGTCYLIVKALFNMPLPLT
jgi:hypothetical protein